VKGGAETGLEGKGLSAREGGWYHWGLRICLRRLKKEGSFRARIDKKKRCRGREKGTLLDPGNERSVGSRKRKRRKEGGLNRGGK